MNPRYFVTYRHWNGTATETSTHALGRFYDPEAAMRKARDRYGIPGYEILGVRSETSFEAARYQVYRFFMRTFRIACAGVIAFFAYPWLSQSFPAIGDIPLGEITLNMAFSAVFRGALMLGAGGLCWILAFGEGPQDDC